MSELFKNLEKAALKAGITPRTRESIEWFRKKASTIRGVNTEQLMKSDRLDKTNNEVVGHMYMFSYDPKTKDKLPYYDSFPLAIVVGPADGGFYGLNLHYLPQTLRAKFLDALLEITNNDKFDDTTKIKMSYNMLRKSSKMRYFQPCFKHYLTRHVKGQLAKVHASDYEIATFLPTADWNKASTFKVYADSRKIISGL